MILTAGFFGLRAAGILGPKTPAAPGPSVTDAPTEAPTAEPTDIPTQAPTATATQAPTPSPSPTPSPVPTAEPTSVPTANPNNAGYTFKPRGAAPTTGENTWVVPANSLCFTNRYGLYPEMNFRWEYSGLPQLKSLAWIETTPHEDGNEYHKYFKFTKTDGTQTETDIQTAGSIILFPDRGRAVSVMWKDVRSIYFDWDAQVLFDWPEYVRFHLKDGQTITAPAHTLVVATHDKPAENVISFNLYFDMPEDLRTARGYTADFSEIRAISFGEGTYEKDKHGWWPEEIKPGWITELPMGISFRDGRYLETKAAEDYIKFFAVDQFGTVEARPDDILYMDFVTDLTEEVEAPPVTDIVPTEAPGAVGGHPEFNLDKHTWGDYEPRGTVRVTMKDGTGYTGIGNSFLMVSAMMTSDLFKVSEQFLQGIGSAAPDKNLDDIPLKSFLELTGITRAEDGWAATDTEGNTPGGRGVLVHR